MEFRIKEGGFVEIKKAMIIKTIPIALLAAGAGLGMRFFNPNEHSSGVNSLLFVVPVVVGALAFGIYRAINRHKALFESYKLIVNENEIVREQINTETISIPHNEVKSIIKTSKGILTIVGKSASEIIGVPSQIDDSEELEELLAQNHSITYSDKKSLIGRYIGIIILLTLGLMASVYISSNKLVVGVAGTILIMLIGYSLYEAHRNKNIDKKTKKSMIWLFLVLFSIIGVMYFKLTGRV